MARLIDADELKRRWLEETCFGWKDIDDAELIDEQPTIDAIPVDWLEKRLSETAEATAQGKDESDLNNAIFTVLVEWETERNKNAID